MNFSSLVFGHLFGDYIFQNNWMAFNKQERWLNLLVHCAIYTACIALFTWNFTPHWIALVFFSHLPIDRWGLADQWLMWIRGRSRRRIWDAGAYLSDHGDRQHERANAKVLYFAGFNPLVYTLVDNTMHLSLMWYGYIYFQKMGWL